MAHAQKTDFVFCRNGGVHLNRRGRQFSRLLAAEVCAPALVMLDTPRSEVVWEYWLPTPFASFLFTSPPVRYRVPSGFKRTPTPKFKRTALALHQLVPLSDLFRYDQHHAARNKKLEHVNEFFSSLSTEGSNTFLYIGWVHSAAHIRCRAGTSTNSSLDCVPKTVLSRLHSLAKESKNLLCLQTAKSCICISAQPDLKASIGHWRLRNTNMTRREFSLLHCDHYVQRTYKNYGNKKFITENFDISE